MDKEDVVCIHNEILLSHKKQWNPAICDNTDGPWGYYLKWNKPDKDKHRMISFTGGTQTHMDKENRLVVTRGEEVCGVGTRGEGVHLYGDWQRTTEIS